MGSIVDVRRKILRALPAGDLLPEETWRRRHFVILMLVWAHVPTLMIVGVLTGNSFFHSFLEGSLIGTLALGASMTKLGRALCSAMATLGLVASSAILVHFSHGLIEMHFHFFVMVAVVTLYQAWMPFLLAIAFVLLHHGTMGAIDPSAVFNHPAAVLNPWKWAAVHAMFIAGESAACLSAWKLNELGMDSERRARKAFEQANQDLAEAQSLARVGSWDWDTVADRVWWSSELYRIAGVSEGEFVPALESFMELVHPDDKDRVTSVIDQSVNEGTDFDYETRIVRPDGSIRTIHALGRVNIDESGAVVRLTGTVQDISDRKTLEERVEHQAFHDSLTGLANRALFLDRVEHALQRQSRQTSSLAVLFLDLDDFKTVNDSMGHAAGDELLVELAQQLSGSLRPADTVARLGGDEFAILLEDIDAVEYAVMVAERLLESLQAPVRVDGTDLYIHTSIGIAVSSSDKPNTTGEILRNADTAMYVAKHNGKGSFELFESGMQEVASERLRLKADLQRAIDNREFILHYQPIVDLDSGKITGVEALIRWQHPERGMVPPLDFIPLAEETGLILPISRWVLHEACRTAARWNSRDRTNGPLTMTVNVSALQFRNEGLLEELIEVLAATGLDPQRLVLEITESVLVNDPASVADRLKELKSIGVQLAIDDFGTGYSSLSYLRDFPIDMLKVDKKFIDSVALGPEDSALARAIIKLGHTLGLKVVGEGIEEHTQAATLQALRCEYGQGYLFAKPMDRRALEELLHETERGIDFPQPMSSVAV